MTSSDLDLMYHFMPVLAVTIAVLINLTAHRRGNYLRAITDGRRLRSGLRVELGILRSVYEENLRTLDKGGENLPSCRQMISLYRGNLGRMQLLDEHEVSVLVAAYGFVEVIESYLNATCRMHGGHAHRASPGEAPISEIRQRYEAGCQLITDALCVLDETAMRGNVGRVKQVAADRAKVTHAAPIMAEHGGASA